MQDTIFESPEEEFVPSNEQITKIYKFGRFLGQGSVSVVHEACLLGNKKTKFAIKKVHKKLVDKQSLDFFMKEVSILKKLDHPNIVKFKEVYDNEETLYMV